MPKKKRKSSKKRRGHAKKNIEKEYYEEVEYTCPDTGKKLTQRVKVTRLKSKFVSPWQRVVSANDIDVYDSDLPYEDDEESEE